jgi:membrane protease YdiL (CAAX protease family)
MTPILLTGCILGGVASTMAVPIGFKLAGTPPSFLRDLGFRAGPRGNAAAWLLALVVTAGYAAFTIRGVPAVAANAAAFSGLKLIALFAAIAAGVVEEAFFRRWLMDAIRGAGGATWIQVVASALAFGLAHATWGLMSGSLHAAEGAAIATTVLGAALAIVYLAGGRSLAPCIVAHFLIDAVIEPGLVLGFVTGHAG